MFRREKSEDDGEDEGGGSDGGKDVFVLSNACLNQYPVNSLSHFTNVLHAPLDLRTTEWSGRGVWQQQQHMTHYAVAVKSLFFDAGFDNFPLLQKPYLCIAQFGLPNLPGKFFWQIDRISYGGSMRGTITVENVIDRLNADLRSKDPGVPRVPDCCGPASRVARPATTTNIVVSAAPASVSSLLDEIGVTAELPGVRVTEVGEPKDRGSRAAAAAAAEHPSDRSFLGGLKFKLTASGHVTLEVERRSRRTMVFLDRQLCFRLGLKGMFYSKYDIITHAIAKGFFATNHAIALGSGDVFETLYGAVNFLSVHESQTEEKQKEPLIVVRGTIRAKLSRGFPNSVNVKLPQIAGTPCSDLRNGSTSHTVYSATIPGQRTGTYELAPKRLKYYKLRGQHDFASVEVALQDEWGRPLALQDGQATVVQLNFRKMQGLSATRFNMLLRSTHSKINHPQNKANNFKVNFPVYQFQPSPTKWGVALDTLILPLDFNHLMVPPEDLYIELVLEQGDKLKIPFDYVRFKHNEEMVRYLQYKLNTEGASHVSLSANKEHQITLKSRSGGTISFHKQMAYLLGERPSPTHDVSPRITFTIPKGGSKTFVDTLSVVRLVPHNIVVLANIVLPTQFGGGQQKVLKLIHIPHQDLQTKLGTYVTFESERLDFKEIWPREISEIEIELKNLDETPVAFWDMPNKEITIVLAFEQRSH